MVDGELSDTRGPHGASCSIPIEPVLDSGNPCQRSLCQECHPPALSDQRGLRPLLIGFRRRCTGSPGRGSNHQTVRLRTSDHRGCCPRRDPRPRCSNTSLGPANVASIAPDDAVHNCWRGVILGVDAAACPGFRCRVPRDRAVGDRAAAAQQPAAATRSGVVADRAVADRSKRANRRIGPRVPTQDSAAVIATGSPISRREVSMMQCVLIEWSSKFVTFTKRKYYAKEISRFRAKPGEFLLFCTLPDEIADCGLRIADLRLWTLDFRLWTA